MKRYPYLYYLIFLLTLLDVLCTAVGLQIGIIEEGNPIMNYLFGISMEATMIGVLLVVGVLLWVLFRASREVKWLLPAMKGVAGIKVIVIVMHLRWISVVLSQS